MDEKLTYEGVENGESHFTVNNRRHELWSKQHGIFRIASYTYYMKKAEERFCLAWAFEGDEKFTWAIQQTFLRLLFRYGFAAIINPYELVGGDIVEKALPTNDPLVDQFKGLLGKLKNTLGERLALGVAPTHYDVNENVRIGVGNMAPRYTGPRRTYVVSAENAALGAYSKFFFNGFYHWALAVYLQSITDTVLKKRVAMIDAKLAYNLQNNAYRPRWVDDIYDVDVSILDLSPSSVSATDKNDTSMRINVGALMNDKIQRVDMSNKESINDVQAFIEENHKKWLKANGVRIGLGTGSKTAKNGNIDEYISMESHFRLHEEGVENELKVFAENYKRMFGVELTVINKMREINDELDARQMLLSTGGTKGDAEGDQKMPSPKGGK